MRRQIALRDAGGATDRDLLQRFAHGRDGDAFAALVQRHGPLVLGVCRRVLRREQDAEDAFQATFLVLARKAGSIGQPELLGNWLYGVAGRVARKARADASRRRAHEQRVTDMSPRPPTREAGWEDLREVLDDEVRRLPDKFRAPLVLCYMQDLTREEAAARLGWSPGAVKGMLERGREVLRSRLARRGVAVSVGSLAAMLSGDALSAAVPAVLMDSTVRAAVAFAVRDAAAAGSAAALAEGVLQAMWMTRLKVWLAVVLVLGAALTGAGVAAYGMRPAEDPTRAKGPDPPPDAVGQADQLKRLAEARRDASRRAYEGYWERFDAGIEREEVVHLWSRRWLQAQLDLSGTKAEHDAALVAYQDRLRKTDEIARARLVLGNSPEGTLDSMFDKMGNKKFQNEKEYFEATWKAYENCEATEEQVCLASVRWLMYQHRARKIIKKIDPKAELQAHLDRVKKVERIAEARHQAGKTTDLEYKTATFFRLQAEEWLAQGKSFEEKGEDPGASSK
jgi:RNA polymerase sigma factor (sigma-70 family)